MKFTFKAKATGNATISYSGSKQPDADAKYVNISSSSKTISITNPPSTNNNLSSLSVSNGSINFNKNTTNYNISVDTNVTSIKISATAEDKGASVSGTGTKNLGYGNNKFSIIVTAPSGDKKTYTITVNRKDNRSSNNKLSSLSVDGVELSPKFNSNTKNYTVSVPFSISSLKINAKSEDSKSKVSISNTSINAEETKDINITVTAENGGTNTYVIRATRGKDPNKVLSKNNNLSSLKISQGILSPAFKKEQDKYIVYLPYEADSIKIDATVEDTKYATIKIEGTEKLSTGNNNYKIIVTAEDGSTKTYTVVVSRGLNMTEESLSSNVYLKSITLKKGSLKENFNKEVFDYTYTGSEIEAVPEDDKSTVNIINRKDKSIIIVKSQSGDIGVYTLTKYKFNFINIIIYILLSLTTILSATGCYLMKNKLKKINPDLKNKNKKNKVNMDNK